MVVIISQPTTMFKPLALQFIKKLYDRSNIFKHLCFQGSKLRTQHWTVHSQRMLWSIKGCTNNWGMCCLYRLIMQRDYWSSYWNRVITNLILVLNNSTVLRQRQNRTIWRFCMRWFWININNTINLQLIIIIIIIIIILLFYCYDYHYYYYYYYYVFSR